MVLAEPRHEPKVRQGVTTELIGVDGNGYAPFPKRQDLLDFVRLNAGLDGRPDDTVTSTGTRVASTSTGTTADVSVNVASLVGNSPLRIAALGWDDVRGRRTRHRGPAARCSARRWRTGRSGCRPGSTTRRAPTRRPRSSRRSPGRPADSAGSTTPTSATRWATGSWTRSGRRSRSGAGAGRRPTSPTSTIGRRSPGPPEQMLALVDDARAEGLDVTFDLYPYEWSSTRLLIMLPTWVQAGGPDRLKERLADRAVRARIRDEMQGTGHDVRRRRRLGRSALGDSRAARASGLGGPDARRGPARRRAREPSTRSATCSSRRTSRSTR